MSPAHAFCRRGRAQVLAGLVLMASCVLPVLSAPAVRAATDGARQGGPARADFNHDGFDDLAIGVPLEDIVAVNQGAVEVIYGSADGLDPQGSPDQLLVQNDTEGPEAQDGFGLALAGGDFNGDGFGDLAVGANGEDIGPEGNNEGSVTVFYGSRSGLVARSAQYLTERTPGENHQVGFTMTAGDFNGDGRDELAISVLNQTVKGVPGAGGVLLFPGAATGLDAAGIVEINQDSPGANGQVDASDQFGSVLAAGDINGDGRDDLAAGNPNETVSGKTYAGAVSVFFGCAPGAGCDLLDPDDQFVSQNSRDVAGTAEQGDLFGIALAVGNFGRDGRADLAVGVLREDGAGAADAGAVEVFYGTPSGLATAGAQLFLQGRGGVPDRSEASDEFGAVLAAGDVGKGSQDDLIVGTPFEDLGAFADAGAVTVLYGGPDGLSTVDADLITQDSPRIPSAAAAGYGFGKTLAVADFGWSSKDDVAVGSRDTVNGVPTAGAVTVIYGVSGLLHSAAHVQYLTQATPGVKDSPESDDLFGGAWGQPGLAG